MNKLSFCAVETANLVRHSFASDEHKETLGGESGPGIFLIGDQGVYLLSTGNPGQPNPKKKGSLKVVYAEGCDPSKDEDNWYDNKARTFGHDDGLEYLPISEADLKFLETAKTVVIEFNDETLSVSFVKARTFH